MKSRAKCKLCNSILESKGIHDVVSCKCGEISIDRDGYSFHVHIKNDKSNLIMIDDEGNEILPKAADPLKAQENDVEYSSPTSQAVFEGEDKREVNMHSKRELLAILDAMAHNIDSLPPSARFTSVTHTDFSSLLTLLSELFRAS